MGNQSSQWFALYYLDKIDRIIKEKYYTYIQPDSKVTIKVAFEKKTDTKPAIQDKKPTDDTKSPQAGDNSNLWLWFALIFVSGGIITTIVYLKKKKQSMK
ncbi:MAG: hypothetical protein Q4F11_09630 [Eubacteriales bacterium]|nr:hypothetical protein [Eubacteriales bacterium]